MPFTPSHIAAVLPFDQSKKLSITALVIGSMAPDFEFFFQMREVENIGHHWYGIFLFDLPVTLLLSYVYHVYLKKSFVVNLPEYFRKRCIHVLDFDWRDSMNSRPYWMIGSSLLGIATHFFWDGFTHYDGIFVPYFHSLSNTIIVFGKSMPAYFGLQLMLSGLGLLIITHYIHRLPIQTGTRTDESPNSYYWLTWFCTMAFIMFIRLSGWKEYNSFWSVFIAVMGGSIYSWIISTFILKKLILKK